MSNLCLLVKVAGERVAFPAIAIEAVVELENIAPVPRSAPHVAGLAALRSRLITVIDVRVALGLTPMPRREPLEAVIVTSDGHSYGLLVDAVEDVAEANARQPVLAPLGGGWAQAARAMVDLDGALHLLIDPEALIAPRFASAA